MKRKKNTNQEEGKPILGVGWYKENQWALLLKHSVDRENLEPTYAEWLEGISEGIENLSKSGLQVVKIPIDVEEMIKWCKESEYPFDGESRATYISLKTKELFG